MQSNSLFTDNPAKWSKWFVLILIELIPFSYHFGYENLQAIQTQLVQTLQIDLSGYNLLYAVTDFPSIFIPLLVNKFATKISIRNVLLTMTFFISFGQFVVAIGGVLNSYSLLLAGRLLYGMFCEATLVCSQLALHLWFTEQEFSFAISMQSIIMGISKSANSLFVPRIMETTQEIGNTLFCCFMIGIISFVAALFYILFEVLSPDLKANEENEILHTVRESVTPLDGPKTYWQVVRSFPRRFWMLVAMNGLFQGCFFGLSDVINDFFHVKFGFSNSFSGDLILIMYLLITVFAPIMGRISSTSETKGYLLIIASMSIFFVFLIILGMNVRYAELNAILVVVLGGFFWATFHPTVYGAAAEIVDKRSLGIAYSFLSITSEIAVSGLPLLGAIINDATKMRGNYTIYMLYQLFLSITALVISLFFFREELQCCGYGSVEHEAYLEAKIDLYESQHIMIKNIAGNGQVVELKNSSMLSPR